MIDTMFERHMKEPGFQRVFQEESLIFEVTEAICEQMQKKRISRTELGRRMGVSKGYISQLLSGERNMELKTLANILFHLGCELDIKLRAPHEGAEPTEDETDTPFDLTTDDNVWSLEDARRRKHIICEKEPDYNLSNHSFAVTA